MKRRRFVRSAAAAAAVGATGCIGGGDGNDENEEDTPETAGFGYQTWVPAAEYRLIGYVDLAAMRELTTLSRDDQERNIIGETTVPYADISGILTATGTDFEAYAGSFDISVDDAFPDAETSEHAGFEVAAGTVDGEEVEMAASDEGIVVGHGGTSTTSVIDAAIGDTARQADEGDIIGGLSEYAEGEPLAVQFDFGVGNTAYQFFEGRDNGMAFVEVAFLPDEEAVEQTIEEDYNYSDGRLEDLNMSVRGEGRRLIIESIVSPEEIEESTFGTNGLLP